MTAPLPLKGTTIVISNTLLFGPDPEGDTHTSYASLEEPEESLFPREDVGPTPEQDHHHHRPHARDRRHADVTPPHRHADATPLPPHRPADATLRHGSDTTPRSHSDVTPANIHAQAPHDITSHFTKANADAVRATAHKLGISPRSLSTIIGYETIGSYSPSKQGLGGHAGLIQFGREEQRKYGVHPGQTFPEQMPAVEQYLRDRGVKPGMGLRDIYSTVLAGAPGRYSARDKGGTVDEHVARMQRDRSAQAERFLASGRGEARGRLLGGTVPLGPNAPDSEHASRKRLLGFEDIPLSGAASEHGAGYSLGHMDPDFRRRLAHMMAAAKAAGRPLSVFSGYRSQEHQNRLFAESDRSGHMVARHSHHTAGTAADLRGDLAWAHAHAADFGLQFPMPWESWHIEPISARAARAALRPHAETGAPKVYASTGPLPHTPAPPAKAGAKDELYPMPGETIEQYQKRQDRILNRRIPRPGWGYPPGREREDV